MTSLQNQKFESQMKIESETRSSQPVNDAGSKKLLIFHFLSFFFVDISISFLSINEIKRKLKGKKIEKRKMYFVHIAL